MSYKGRYEGSVLRALKVSGGNRLHRTGISALWREIDGVWVDSIGLSANALWAALPTTHRSIYLVDENTLRSAEDIITNIEASGYLNDGGELLGTEAEGYAQYADGTNWTIIDKALKYFGQPRPLRIDGAVLTVNDDNIYIGV